MKYNNNTVEFRYSSRYLYFLLFYGTWIVTTVLFVYCIYKYLYAPFYGDNHIPNREYSGILFWSILLSILIASASGPILGLLLALRVTDKNASGTFYNNKVVINKYNKTITIHYEDIVSISFLNIYTSSKGHIFGSNGAYLMNVRYRGRHIPMGPYVYRMIIVTKKSKYRFQGSYKESWEVRRNNTYHSIYSFCRKFTDYGWRINYDQTTL